MEGIACPVRHVVQELVVCHYNKRGLGRLVDTVTEIRANYLNDSADSSDIFFESVCGEDDRPLVAFDIEGRDLLIVCHDLVVVELLVWVN